MLFGWTSPFSHGFPMGFAWPQVKRLEEESVKALAEAEKAAQAARDAAEHALQATCNGGLMVV
jgi:hypothetical protein